MIFIRRQLEQKPYESYAYSYPHKTAYRPLARPVPLVEAWAGEDKNALFLYLHIPFCEMRCGFCNLFTTANPKAEWLHEYLSALRRQARQVSQALGPANWAQMALGGGTPTFLSASQLHLLFDLSDSLGVSGVPVSCETSPLTATPEKLTVLRERGVTRLSMGVQSFIEKEANAAGRPQRTADVVTALEHIRAANFPTLNLDLMYGLPGQTVESWLASLRIALTYAPQELYLYPLYVRPLTGLGQKPRAWDDLRLTCYRAGRDFLHAHGWRQLALRMFQAPDAPASTGPLYCCQDDGMVGLGCGARSYTRALHYANEYAVGARGVREIIGHFLRQKDFSAADYGVLLDAEEQRRRYLIKSLLRVEGLNMVAYRARFARDADADFPTLRTLRNEGLATFDADTICLTADGLELSDAIGPALYSSYVQTRSQDYEWS